MHRRSGYTSSRGAWTSALRDALDGIRGAPFPVRNAWAWADWSFRRNFFWLLNLACAVPSPWSSAESANVWARALEKRTCPSASPAFSGPIFLPRGRVSFWDVPVSPGPLFPGQLRALGFPSFRAGAELFPGPGRRCSRAGKTWSEKPPATPRIQLPHGSPGALEAVGVLRAANQPGDAGGEDPCRGYPLRGVGAGATRWTPGLLLLIYFF